MLFFSEDEWQLILVLVLVERGIPSIDDICSDVAMKHLSSFCFTQLYIVHYEYYDIISNMAYSISSFAMFGIPGSVHVRQDFSPLATFPFQTECFSTNKSKQNFIALNYVWNNEAIQ